MRKKWPFKLLGARSIQKLLDRLRERGLLIVYNKDSSLLTFGNLIDSRYLVTASSNKHAFPSFMLYIGFPRGFILISGLVKTNSPMD